MWALITGASAGIGAATAEALAEKKWDLILTARREGRLREVAQRLSVQHKIKVEIAGLDVRDRAHADRLAKDHAGKEIALLVNNAGLAKGIDKVFAADSEDWDVMIDTNIKGLLYDPGLFAGYDGTREWTYRKSRLGGGAVDVSERRRLLRH